MNLLPKNEIDFTRPQYWDKFFKQRGSKEFEWYGDFTELCVLLEKYLKRMDSILMIGCGNSTLSLDLYNVGYRNITNIDISSVAITQMKAKVGMKKTGMIFEEMDALNMSYEPEKFSVVLDKGTLDALMPSDTEEDRIRAGKLFGEINRVLKMNGRYIIISLLQEHILDAILKYFTEAGWLIRISRCWDVEKRNVLEKGLLTMPVFMVVCVKFIKSNNTKPLLELNVNIDGKFERMATREEVMSAINGIQRTVFHCKEAKGEMEVTFCRNGETDPRYTVYVVDATQDHRDLLKYAAFIVPHGRETEWLFGSPEGRRHLRGSSGFDRLAVITFHRNQVYGSMEKIQNELRRTLLQFVPPLAFPAPGSLNNIPYLSLGDGVGRGETVYAGTSALSGELLVEDVQIEGEHFRRLVFMGNQAVVQSEVKLNKGPRGTLVDASRVTSHHVLFMSVGAAAVASPKTVAVVGVGGGSLCLLLRDLFPGITVTGVELDPLVVDLAQRYFGLNTDDRLRIRVGDGVEFLEERNRFDVIMLDVDSKERGSALGCPPPRFVETSVLTSIAESLGETGVFVANVVSRVRSEHEKLIKKLRKHFTSVSWYNLKEDVNRIVYATNAGGLIGGADWDRKIKDSASLFQVMLNERGNPDGGAFDLDHFMEGLTIECR